MQKKLGKPKYNYKYLPSLLKTNTTNLVYRLPLRVRMNTQYYHLET